MQWGLALFFSSTGLPPLAPPPASGGGEACSQPPHCSSFAGIVGVCLSEIFKVLTTRSSSQAWRMQCPWLPFTACLVNPHKPLTTCSSPALQLSVSPAGATAFFPSPMHFWAPWPTVPTGLLPCRSLMPRLSWWPCFSMHRSWASWTLPLAPLSCLILRIRS